MQIERLIVGPMQVNCYIVICEQTQKAMIVDPGDDEDRVLAFVREKGLTVTDILLTHGHVDHTAAVPEIQAATGARICIHKGDEFLVENSVLQAEMFGLRVPGLFRIDDYIHDDQIIKVGEGELVVISTPGHSPGSICLLGNQELIAGDTLFENSIGRTDLPGGSYHDLIGSINSKLMVLDENIRVLPGHGNLTTIGHEKTHNPYLLG